MPPGKTETRVNRSTPSPSPSFQPESPASHSPRSGHAGRMAANITLYDDEFPLLEGVGLYAAQTSGDGDCLFHALSDQLYGNENQHLELRISVVDHLSKNSDYFKSFIDVAPVRRAPRRRAAASSKADLIAHTEDEIEKAFQQRLQRMRNSGVFGDNLEIQAFAREFGVDVKIYQREFSYVIQADNGSSPTNGGDKKRPVVHIAYHTWEHYSSIRNRDGPHSGLPHVELQVPTPRTVQAGKKKAATVHIQPWMEKVVGDSLPYTESPEKILETLREFKGDVDSALLHLIDKWDDENGLNPEGSPEPEEHSEVPTVSDVETVLEAGLRAESEPSEISEPEFSVISELETPLDPATPASSLGSEYQETTDIDDDYEDYARSKRRKSPDGTPVTPLKEKTRSRTPTPEPEQRRRKSTRAVEPTQPAPRPTRRSPRIRAKATEQTLGYASDTSSSGSCSSGNESDETVIVSEPVPPPAAPRSRKQKRQQAKAKSKAKRKVVQPSAQQRKDVGATGSVKTLEVGIRELYV